MSKSSLFKCAGSVLALCALQAGAVDLSPTVDTYVHSGSPTASNGTKTVLETKTAATSSRDSYLKFDLSAQSTITKVELKVYAKYNTTGSVTCGVHGVANTSWTDAMTWNTKAALGSQLATATVTNTGAWITYDVTSYALSEYNAGRKVIALGLHNTQTTSSHVTFNSKENTANKPVLVVTTSGGGGGGTDPLVGAMEYYDGSKWVSLPIGKPGEVLSVASGKIPQWTQIPGTVSDIDGTVYKTVVIGNQEWTVENIRTTHYQNGDAIAKVTNGASWQSLTSGAYCFYNNTTTRGEQVKYGALYNAYAVNDSRGLAPQGWRVPTDADWTALENYMSANGYNYDGTTSGNKIAKSLAAPISWDASAEVGAIGNDPVRNNTSEFCALSTGYRSNDYNGEFTSKGQYASWWSTTPADYGHYFREMNQASESLLRKMLDNRYGRSVRLVRDVQ